MELLDIANLRLVSQQVIASRFQKAKDLVDWMGAMQAQDHAMAKWAVGLRLQSATEALIEAALNRGEILRTHVLRPTWHLVSSENIRWMMELTAPQIRTRLKTRHNHLGLTQSILLKCNKILEKLLRDGHHSTREELIIELTKAKIATDENRASHIFLNAELDMLICSGEIKDGRQTFALLDERIPQKKKLNRDESLASLAKKYFASHGPATLEDFAWWSGLPVGASKYALELAAPELISVDVKTKRFWFSEETLHAKFPKDSIYLLPAFDEFIISYKDRSATITMEDHKKAVSNNGIFHPTLVVKGETVGIWNRKITRDKVLVEFEYFKNPPSMSLIENATAHYAAFLGKSV